MMYVKAFRAPLCVVVREMNRMYGTANDLPVALRTNGPDRTSPASLELDCSVPWSRRKLAPRQHIFHQGDEQTHVYVVKSGFVRLYSLLNNGRCQVIGFKSPDEFVAFEYGPNNRVRGQAGTATGMG